MLATRFHFRRLYSIKFTTHYDRIGSVAQYSSVVDLARFVAANTPPKGQYLHCTTGNNSFHNIKYIRPIISNHDNHVVTVRKSLFSSEKSNSSTLSFSPITWWKGRQEKKEEEKYKQRIYGMAEMDKWTIGMMLHEINEAATSWTAKLVNNKESEAVKKMHKTLMGLVRIVGEDATYENIANLSRKGKLEAAIAGETSVEEINIMIAQFHTMSLMHRILRHRKVEGKSIPETAEAMQSVMQADSMKFLTKEQKKKLAKQHARMLTRRR
jgi:uncharacterized protein